MNIKRAVSFAFAAGSILILSNIANAQGRYVNTYSRNQVSDIIKRAENSSDTFRTEFRRRMNSNHNLSSSQKNQYNGYVASCEDALDRLRRRFDSDNTWWNSRSQVQDVVSNSTNVNTMMNVLPFRRDLERQWNQLRNDINTLADTYDLPGLNGGGWNGGPWNPGNPGGGQTSTPPTWAQGTFYSTNGAQISLTINRNGQVTVVNGGQTFYGTYFRNNLTVNGDVSTVSQSGNGIRTYNRSTGQTTVYSRNGWGGGGGGTTRPPSWAVGNFYSTNNGSISLNIAANGRVTVINNGQSFFGTYYNGVLNVNGDSSTVTRNGNGIRTYNQSTGQTTNYRRR